MRKPVLCSPYGESSHTVTKRIIRDMSGKCFQSVERPMFTNSVLISLSRLSLVAVLSIIFSSVLGIGTLEAKTKKQCDAEERTGSKRCGGLPEPGQCLGQVYQRWAKCSCEAGGGVYSVDSSANAHCQGGSHFQYFSPDTGKPPKNVPHGPGSAGTPPKSEPTPKKPKGPDSVGTPPKSNPTTPVKPRTPGNVTAPKSNPTSGGGTILRSGNSGSSNSNNSGGGNSGGSKR